MRTFAEFVELQETSLNRIRSKSEKGGMAILSGQRGDKSSKENKERSKRTEKRIRGAGLPKRLRTLFILLVVRLC